jgi:hypothetical protein
VWAARGTAELLGLPHVDTIESQNVEMDIESERIIRSLNGDDCAGERFTHAAEAEQLFGAASQRAHRLAGEGACGASAQLAVVAEHGPHAPGEAADPVTDGHLGKTARSRWTAVSLMRRARQEGQNRGVCS